jgi:putative addiction module killer protein
MEYTSAVIEIRQTDQYGKWFEKLADHRAKARIDVRIRRMSLGNFGDVKPVGEGISELRIDYGPGYRVYFTRKGNQIIVLLAGGDKSTQDKDIQAARKLLHEIEV